MGFMVSLVSSSAVIDFAEHPYTSQDVERGRSGFNLALETMRLPIGQHGDLYLSQLHMTVGLVKGVYRAGETYISICR